jgi:hypothetical protein
MPHPVFDKSSKWLLEHNGFSILRLGGGRCGYPALGAAEAARGSASCRTPSGGSRCFRFAMPGGLRTS